MSNRQFDTRTETKSSLSRQPVRRREQGHVAETSIFPKRDPLPWAISSAGNLLSASTHAAMLKYATAGRPSRAGQSLLQLQRQYGNRYVQRVLALAGKGTGEAEAAPDVEQAIQRVRGGGQALDSGARTQMESAFGADFGDVRVHTDTQADTLNRELNARAFTTGQDIFFRQGAYNPGSSNGQELLAHELTHVVQQNGDKVQRKLTVGQPGDKYEQEADQVARAVMQQEQQPVQGESDEGLVRRQIEEEEEEETLQRKPVAAQVLRQTEEGEEKEETEGSEDAGFEIEIKPGPISQISKASSQLDHSGEHTETPEGELQRKMHGVPDIQKVTPAAVGAAVAVVAITYSVVKDLVVNVPTELKYSFDRMKGQKYPKNNKNWEQITPWYPAYYDIFIYKKNRLGNKCGMKVRLHWEFNGYGLSGIYFTKRWIGKTSWWAIDFDWLIQPLMATRKDVNGHPVAQVKIALTASYTSWCYSNITNNWSWIIDGEGKKK